jgi:hypothetical protein
MKMSVVFFLLAGIAFGESSDWVRKSSTTGDLQPPNSGSQQTCCVTADFDGDGMDDFVVGERTATPSVVWYAYDQENRRWTKRVIDQTSLRPEAGGICCDVDRDGDPDVILGQDASGPNIWWWENPSPDFSEPWKRRTIKKGGAPKHHDQTVGDFDGDGSPEFVTWNQGAKKLLLYEIPEDPRGVDSWPATEIFSWESGQELEGFPSTPVDVDLDGKVDLIGGGRWFKHQGGTDYEPHVIDEEMRFTQCAAGQLVEGGRPEIVFSPGDTDGEAKWYQWSDGQWHAKPLGYVVHGHTCDIADLNGDGHPDIMIGEMGDPGAGNEAKVRIWHGNGRGDFQEEVISEGLGIHEGLLGDFDGDGDLDILHKPYHHKAPRVDVLLNSTVPDQQ